jgi:CBS-domain-containing membrane protein
VIIRVLGEGQYRVDEEAAAGLNELDEQVGQAVESGDEENLQRLLKHLADAVRERGERLDDADLSPSDAIVPPDDLSLDEARELLQGEGLIPDIPSR